MKITIGLLFSVFFYLLLSGCTEKYPAVNDGSGISLAEGGCVACHTDQDWLKKVADPLPPPPDGGDSGEG